MATESWGERSVSLEASEQAPAAKDIKRDGVGRENKKALIQICWCEQIRLLYLFFHCSRMHNAVRSLYCKGLKALKKVLMHFAPHGVMTLKRCIHFPLPLALAFHFAHEH